MRLKRANGRIWQTVYDTTSAEVLRPMKAGEVYLCDWCNGEIILTPVKRCKFRTRVHHFCSKNCYLNFHSRNTRPLVCYHCGKEITAKFDGSKMRRNGGKRFCSKFCTDEWRRKTSIRTRQTHLRAKYEAFNACPPCKITNRSKIKTTCTQCEEPMFQDKYGAKKYLPFCSKKCLSKYQSILFSSRPKPNCACVICNKPLHRPRCRLNIKEPTCSSKCYKIWHSMRLAGPNHPAYRGDDGRGYKDFTAEIKRRVRERDGSHCVLCGGTRRLVAHHINYDKKNPSADNLITICRECHNYTNLYRWFWKKLFSELMVKIVEARTAILQGQTNVESQKIEHHTHCSPFPTLGTTAQSLYRILARLHPKSVLRPTDESCPEHIQIPFVKELLCRIEWTPSTEPSSRNLHSPEWQSGTGFP